MTKKWILYDKDDWQVTWPACINHLSPVKNALGAELPAWIRQAFNRKGIFNENEMIVPIRPIAVLGQCSTAKYTDCPNIPKHHIENARNYGNPARYLDVIGQYYWFDFDFVGADKALIKLRMVVNSGDADCNDGFWGAVWKRNTGELVINILSSGDMETTIQAVSKKFIDSYKPYDVWIPLLCRSNYAKNLELERLVDLAIQICFYPKAEITDTGIRSGD